MDRRLALSSSRAPLLRHAVSGVFSGVLALSCAAKSHSGSEKDSATAVPPSSSVVVDAVDCPAYEDDGAGKLTHEVALEAHPADTDFVTVVLKSIAWPPAPCDGAKTLENCAERDEVLRQRQTLNQKQVDCVLATLGPPGSLPAPLPVWYEALATSANDSPEPVGTSFAIRALLPQLELLAHSPYVERIEPGPGEAIKLGVTAPPIPEECPAPSDAPDSKLGDLASIRDQGRKPVVIELKQSELPALRPCEDTAICDDLIASGWERTVQSTRQLTCVRRLIDSKLEAAAPSVPYFSADGLPQAPLVPPFGDSVHATLAFGLGLTWSEAYETAKHPYVEKIWTSDSLAIQMDAEGCPPDFEMPVAVPACTDSREPFAGKFSASDQALWESSTSANEVLLAIRKNFVLCPRPECPTRDLDNPCPELARYLAREDEEARASQACVRALIDSIGGSASDEVWTVGFAAQLTWDQILSVAAHPDVISVTANLPGKPF